MQSTNQGRTWYLFEFWGKALGYVGAILVDFFGYVPLCYAVLRKCTFIFDSMISDLTLKGLIRLLRAS